MQLKESPSTVYTSMERRNTQLKDITDCETLWTPCHLQNSTVPGLTGPRQKMNQVKVKETTRVIERGTAKRNDTKSVKPVFYFENTD